MNTVNSPGDQSIHKIHTSEHKIHASQVSTDSAKNEKIKPEVVQQTLIQTSESEPLIQSPLQEKHTVTRVNIEHTQKMKDKYEAMELNYNKRHAFVDEKAKESPEYLRFLADYGKSINEYEDAIWDSGFFNWVKYVVARIFDPKSDTSMINSSKITYEFNSRLEELEHEERSNVTNMAQRKVVTKEYQDYTYEGTFNEYHPDKTGIGSGYGTQTFKNGDTYTGEFVLGKKSGRGRFTSAKGDVFEGIYRKDKMVKGKFTHADGSSFEGEFKDNIQSHGVVKNANNETVFKGDLQPNRGAIQSLKNLVTGEKTPFIVEFSKGTYTYTNPNNLEKTFKGNFKDHKPSYGKLTYTDGRIFEGTFNERGTPDSGKVKYPKNAAQKYFEGKVDGAGKPLKGTMYYKNGNSEKIDTSSDTNLEMKHF